MNYPSSDSGNWQWRYSSEQLNGEIERRLRELTEIYGRVVEPENGNNNNQHG
jgi:4-alpha-glucanotransferase